MRSLPASRFARGTTPGPHRLQAAAEVDCDVVVVGSGAGGATAALALVRAGLDVVMLEEGPSVPYESAPRDLASSFGTLWRGGGLCAALGAPPVALGMGRCVGGSTEINAAIMQRCPEPLLEEWARGWQIADFGPAQLAADYDAIAPIVNPSPTPAPHGAATDVIERGARALGWQSIEVERAQRGCVATNQCSIACPTGGKQSMSTTAIRAALGAGLRLVAECRVTRLRLARGRASGVDAIARDAVGRHHRLRIRAGAVFVCAGAVHTPALLRRSGIRHNIGDTLRLHPSLKAIARFEEPLDAARSRLPLRAVTQFGPEQRLGGSMYTPGTFAMALAEDPAARDELVDAFRHCGIYYGMVRAAGTGRIRAVPGTREPLVRYALTGADLQQLHDVCGRLVELLFAAGAIELHLPLAGAPPVRSREQATRALELARTRPAVLQLFTIHAFSSCPPGEDRTRCAVDSFGRVHGVAGLHIADASLIPEAPGVNPQLTVMALAHRSARAFLGARAA